METKKHDLVVLGGGPAGYVAAIRGAQLGLNVACVEQETGLGGTCLRVGCIPSKALLESSHRYWELKRGLDEHGIHVSDVTLDLPAMMKRKDNIVRSLSGGVSALFKENGVTRYTGRGRLDGRGRVVVEKGKNETVLEAPHVLIATGSKPATLDGVELDGDRVGTSTEALSYTEVPEHMVVIGAGYIGLELGSVWSRLGSKVTVLEALDRILPGMDNELAVAAKKILEKQGLSFRLGARVEQAKADRRGAVVRCQGQKPIACDRVLLAVGRVADTESLGLETVGIQPGENGHIAVNEAFQTLTDGLYAAGDCIRGPKLAHKASHEAIACVERIVTGYGHVNYETIPGVVYTYPEVASVGKTEEQLQQAGHKYRRGAFLLRASGRARTLGETEGTVKILADEATDRVLGVHVLGARAGDLIAEAAAAMEFGASAEDLARVCHAHPTLAESLGEAALDVDRRAIHVVASKKRATKGAEAAGP
ncbi:MAG: dihydrolipoyl dehydrogenase [Planctomycetota bacterium]